MDLSGVVPAAGAPADAVGPSLGAVLSRFGLLSAPFIIVGLSVLIMCLKKNIQVFWVDENAEEVEFFDCETFEDYLNEGSDLEPSEDPNA